MGPKHQDAECVHQVHRRLQSGWIGAACLGDDRARQAVFPGSFNPLHEGHRRMAELAAARLALPVSFELSVTNVEKPSLSADTLWRRCQQFADRDTVWITRAPTFVDKARLFPRAWFIVGADTLQRLVDPAYYDDNAERRDRALERMVQRQVRFLVFGRRSGNQFQELSDMELPPVLAGHCYGVPAAEFREDISSRQLRDCSGGHAP